MCFQSAWFLRGNCSSEMFVELPFSGVVLFVFPVLVVFGRKHDIFDFFSLKTKH